MSMEMKNSKFIHKILTTLFLFGTIGFALGFTKWFNYDGNTLANLPVFPNILDSVFLICGAIYFSIRVVQLEHKQQKNNNKQ
jgi:hypothetical protein